MCSPLGISSLNFLGNIRVSRCWRSYCYRLGFLLDIVIDYILGSIWNLSVCISFERFLWCSRFDLSIKCDFYFLSALVWYVRNSYC